MQQFEYYSMLVILQLTVTAIVLSIVPTRSKGRSRGGDAALAESVKVNRKRITKRDWREVSGR